MNTATATNSTSNPLIFARQIVGMAILALANPLVWYSNEPVLRWLESWGVPVLIALGVFGLYALFFTKRAKQAWPGRFFLLAWVLVALVTVGPWINLNKRASTASRNDATAAVANTGKTFTYEEAYGKPAPTTDQFGGVLTDPVSPAPTNLKPFTGKLDREQAVQNRPAQSTPTEGSASGAWTQESTNSAEIGPWLNHSPVGTRFCRLSDGKIARLYPPGLMPHAEPAVSSCVNSSVASAVEL